MPDGFLIVDKPAGMTSHDVVSRARKALRERSIGHAGTLDPDATGVLLLGVGKGTRLLQFLSGADKTYEAEIELGTTTTTLDAAGEITATFDMAATEPAQVVAAARRFVGAIEQIPPMVSALKVGGKRLHELARQGIEVERKPRPVTVHRFEVEHVGGLVYRAVVECSTGTYIRSLAADLGAALGGGAHLRSLRRTVVGAFSIADACPLDELNLRPVLDMVGSMARVTVDQATATLVGNGRVLDRAGLGLAAASEGPWAVVDSVGALLAIYVAHVSRVDQVKPQVVLVPSGAA